MPMTQARGRAAPGPVLFALALLAAVLAQGATPARAALTCTFGITDISFPPDMNAMTGATYTTTGTISVDCGGGLSLGAVGVCVSLGDGSGGMDAQYRYAAGPSGSLRYDLYSNSGHTTRWTTNLMLSLTLNLFGRATASWPIHAKAYPNAGTAPGSYLSQFVTTDAVITYGLGAILCPLTIGILADTVYVPFDVRGGVSSSCTLSAGILDFGTKGTLGVQVDGSSSLTVTCNAGAPYVLSLGPGGANGTPLARRMTQGTSFVTYGLYQDANRAVPWGDTAGVDTLSGSGTGAGQAVHVYGRVPVQPTPAPGTYTDTVVATVTF